MASVQTLSQRKLVHKEISEREGNSLVKQTSATRRAGFYGLLASLLGAISQSLLVHFLFHTVKLFLRQ